MSAEIILAQEGLRRAKVFSRSWAAESIEQQDHMVEIRKQLPQVGRRAGNTQYYFLDPETIENEIIYFDQKKN